jgi:hypothetical protein
MNARSEFLEHTTGKEVLCAIIKNNVYYYDDLQKRFILRVGFSETELESFLNTINFNYDDGFGAQKLFGNIWYKNGTWSERREYDGSEWWNFQKVPEIPKECTTETDEK